MPETGMTIGLIKALGGGISEEEAQELRSAIRYKTPEQFGAKGDGTTDDSEAVQAACDAGYEVRFADNKTYYLASTVTIDHDVHLVGGENTVIKTATPEEGIVNNAIEVTGTLKKTTTLTSDYTRIGSSTDYANAGNRFELTDMDEISIGDIMVIEATDQLFSPCRGYYYKGGVLLVADVDDDYIWTCDGMPFDIENTEHVSVKIYSAPTAIIDNLKFVSDHESAGEYKHALWLFYCKNSVIRNTEVTEWDNGIAIVNCVNTFIDGLNVSKMPLSGTGRAWDHYGVSIRSSTNTIIDRMMGNAANSAIDITGTIPNLNTYIKHSNLFALSRYQGLGMHENAYNTVVEDCVIGGFQAFGTVFVNRCRFLRDYRFPNESAGISFRGVSGVAAHGRLIVSNCVFESENACVIVPTPYTQDSPQAFDHLIDEIVIENCTGGRFQYTPSTTAYVMSNKINRLFIRNWHGCQEIYHTEGGIIDEMIVENSQFINKLWINDHENNLAFAGIRVLRWIDSCNQVDKMFVDITEKGGQFYLPAGATINCSSNTQTDRYQVCGKNIASNVASDYGVGTVNGWENDSISFTPDNRFSSALTVNASGNLVFTHPNNTDKVSIYPLCLAYVSNNRRIKMSCVLKNTGATTGETFRPYLAVVNCATGKITYRNNNGTVQATAQGEEATHERLIDTGDSLVLFFLYVSTAVAGSETTIENFVAQVVSGDFPEMIYSQYTGSSRTGDGTLQSVEGLNNILVNAAGAFDVNFKADLMERQ